MAAMENVVPPGLAPRSRAQPTLQQDQPVPSRPSVQPVLPPVQGKKAPKSRVDDAKNELVPSHWPGGSMKQAMYALGFDSTRNMLGHVLDMQQREEEFALVRAHRREVGAMLIETWLNDVLSQDRAKGSTCIVERQGMQTYGIDRSQLKKAGLSDMQVDRLHRSLYVYSVGFGDMLQDCISRISARDAVLLNVWQAYNRISEAAVIVGFKSSILDMADLKEAQAAELLVMRDALTEAQSDTANLQKTLAVITGAHLEECSQRQTLKAEADALRESAAAEKEAHGHAVRQYIVEVELRSQLQAEVAEERTAKEHAVFLRGVAEKKIAQLQQEVDAQKLCIGQLDAQVSKTTNALAMEQALSTANQLQKTTVEERMAGLIDQIETMHRKWKEEQEARMQRQNEMYARADELRQARVQLIQSNAATRVMQADNSRLNSKVEELSTQVELQQRRVAEVEAALKVEERRAREARAALDRKRQKKRAHKATAIKFQQLWQKFNAELNHTNARLAEEVEASADTIARSETAQRSMADIALALSVAIKACTAQKTARRTLKRKLQEKETHATQLARQRDVANLQVDCKAKQIAELTDALERTTQEVKTERGKIRDVEHQLTGEKKLGVQLREDLDSVKAQLSDDKDKLCNALKNSSLLTAQVAEMKIDLDSAKEVLAAKREELSDARARFDRLQGSKERVEAELLMVTKQRREAQLSWTEKRTELEGRLQDAKDQIQAKIDEQKDMEQEHQRLEKEIDAAKEALEAKRAKKRKWKEECMAHDRTTANLRTELKDKQFAVEKAMQRFKALEARIEAATKLSKDQEGQEPAAAKDDNKADWELQLAQQQADCAILSGKLQAAREEEAGAQSILDSYIEDPNSTPAQLSDAKDALEIKASVVRQAQARVDSCQEKIALILEEIGGHGKFSDTESQALSALGFKAQEMVLDWTLEMLLASESRLQHATERHTQLEATIRQLVMTNKDVEGQKSNAETTVQNMNRKLRDKMAELEQLRRDLNVSHKSRDKINQELQAAKEEARAVAAQLKESKSETNNVKQELAAVQKNLDRQSAKLQAEKKSEISKMQQQHVTVVKKRDQQVKALFDSKNSIQQQLERTHIELEQIKKQYAAASKATSMAGWIRELEDDTGHAVHEAANRKALNLYDPIIPELKFSPNLLLTLIAQIYCAKIASDRVRERQDNEPLDFPPPATGELDETLLRPNPCRRQPLEHFVYDFFLSRIGSRMLAEVHLAALYSSIVRLQHDSKKISMFGRLLGIFDKFPQGGDDFFLAALSRIHTNCGPLIQEAMSGTSTVGVEEVAQVARFMFKGSSEYLCEATLSITERLRKVADPRSQQVGVDLVLHIMMDTWLEQWEADKAKVVTVFEQALPSGGVLTQEDFKAMMRCINLPLFSALPDRVITEMYREALQLSDKGQKITADAFFQVIHVHGLAGLKTHRMNCVNVKILPPWDEFKLIDESWSGMRCSIEEVACSDEHPDESSYYSKQLRTLTDAFIEKKADLHDPDGSWQAYRRLLRVYTASQLYGEYTGNEPPPLSDESSSRSMRHAPVFDGSGSHGKHSGCSASPQQSKSDVGGSETGSTSNTAVPKRREAPLRLLPKTRLDPTDPGFIEKDFKNEDNSEMSSLAKAAFDVNVDVQESDL